MLKTAMILGAGRGTRLGELGLRVPKVLVPVAGRPLLSRQLDYLAAAGVERVVVNTHHLAEAIETFAAGYTGELDLRVVREPRLLGTAGGVRNALEVLGEEPFFVLYGDVIVDQPLAPVAEAHSARGAAATVTVYASDHVDGKGTVETDDQDWVTAFAEKQSTARAPALVNAGLYVLEPEFAAAIPRGTESDFGHDVFPAALSRGERILSQRLGAPVIDVGTPEGLETARSLVRGR